MFKNGWALATAGPLNNHINLAGLLPLEVPLPDYDCGSFKTWPQILWGLLSSKKWFSVPCTWIWANPGDLTVTTRIQHKCGCFQSWVTKEKGQVESPCGLHCFSWDVCSGEANYHARNITTLRPFCWKGHGKGPPSAACLSSWLTWTIRACVHSQPCEITDIWPSQATRWL